MDDDEEWKVGIGAHYMAREEESMCNVYFNTFSCAVHLLCMWKASDGTTVLFVQKGGGFLLRHMRNA